MKDPLRWCSAGGGAPAGARELLAAAPRPLAIPAGTHARALAAAAELGAAPATTLVSGLGAQLIGGTALGGVVCAAIALSTPQPTPTGTVLASPQETTPVVQVRTTAPVPRAVIAPEASTVLPPPRATRRPPPAHRDTSLAAEAALLEASRAALARDPERALELSREQLGRFPAGQLVAAARYVTAEALRRLGRNDEARASAAELVDAAPESLYADPARQLLHSD